VIRRPPRSTQSRSSAASDVYKRQEQRLGLAAVTTLGDAEDRGAAGERPPERALAAAQAPAGLVEVDGRGGADLVCKLSVGLCERRARVLHDGVDRAGRERGAKQLAQELCGIAPRDAVAHREGGDRRLEARAEGSRRHPGRQLGPCLGGAGGAAQPLQAMLAHPHGDRGQLADLMALRRGGLDALLLTEGTRARSAALGPVIDDLGHLLERKQGTASALVAGLGAPLSARAWPARSRRLSLIHI